jgi:MFS family permease
MTRTPVDGTSAIDLLPAMLVLGIGGGLAFPALMTLAMSSATPEDSGLASGLVNTTQQVGAAFGIAVLATVASNRSGGSVDPASLVAGYHAAFAVATSLVLGALVVAVGVLRRAPANEAVIAEAAMATN